jgi:hypothetical protein
MNYIPTTVAYPQFRAGDPIVVLYEGLYNGIAGRFVSLRKDPNWADIEESGGMVRPHPVLWLRRPQDLADRARIEGIPASSPMHASSGKA